MIGKLFFLAAIFLAVFAEDWQPYVKNQLLGSGRLYKAAILSLDGNILAKSSNLRMSDEEARKLVDLLNNPVSGSRYIVEGLDFVVVNIQSFVHCQHTWTGFIVERTNKVIVFGMYSDGQDSIKAVDVVTDLAEHMKSEGN